MDFTYSVILILIRIVLLKFGGFIEVKMLGNCINGQVLFLHFNLKHLLSLHYVIALLFGPNYFLTQVRKLSEFSFLVLTQLEYKIYIFFFPQDVLTHVGAILLSQAPKYGTCYMLQNSLLLVFSVRFYPGRHLPPEPLRKQKQQLSADTPLLFNRFWGQLFRFFFSWCNQCVVHQTLRRLTLR